MVKTSYENIFYLKLKKLFPVARYIIFYETSNSTTVFIHKQKK